MNKQQIKNILEHAKFRFLENDSHLLSVEANERSLTHKFAEHLQIIIGYSWNVDCEYNREGTDSKKIVYNVYNKHETTREETVGTSDLTANTVYPDIIIHKRGINGPNLLVIEAKKDASCGEREHDINKLRKIQSKYDYQFAVFMEFKIKAKDVDFSFVE